MRGYIIQLLSYNSKVYLISYSTWLILCRLRFGAIMVGPAVSCWLSDVSYLVLLTRGLLSPAGCLLSVVWCC